MIDDRNHYDSYNYNDSDDDNNCYNPLLVITLSQVVTLQYQRNFAKLIDI